MRQCVRVQFLSRKTEIRGYQFNQSQLADEKRLGVVTAQYRGVICRFKVNQPAQVDQAELLNYGLPYSFRPGGTRSKA